MWTKNVVLLKHWMIIAVFRLTKYFLKKGIDQLKANAGKKSDHEKGVLEKLLEINEEFAYIMASDMLFAGVDTVRKRLNFVNLPCHNI